MEILPPGQPDGATHEVHGIRFIRTGSCVSCGACGCDRDDDGSPCPHLKVSGPNQTCRIYDTRDEVCVTCGHDHQYCIDFPTHPFTSAEIRATCGYHWLIAGTGAELAAAVAKLQEMCATWNIAVPIS